MKRSIFLFASFFIGSILLRGQQNDTITANEVSRIINILASDSLKGRGNLQPGLLKAADFIGKEFSSVGLRPLDGLQNYFFPFYPAGGRTEVNDSLIRISNNLPVYPMIGYNIIGLLPGKSKPKEIIMITAHYDHEGVFSIRRGDSIMNGANDNASGTTAMIMLAKYFAKKNDNARTLMFCAFSGEELGLLGSSDFASHIINPDKIIACINLEMLGIPQYGKKRVFVVGKGYSSLYNVLQKNLGKNGLKVISEPNAEKELFMRSDNYPFSQKRIPAHTIMASDDDEKCYHQPCDELYRIDVENMTTIIGAIAASIKPLISGEETPGRSYR